MRSPLSVDPIPAVIVGGELNGLGVCRSLARGNIGPYVLDNRRLHAAMWSRFATPVRVPMMHGPLLIDDLRALQQRLIERPVLFITDEMSLLTISEYRDQLSGLYRFRLPSHSTVMMLHNKGSFHEYAVNQGWPVPKGQVLRDTADIRRLRELRLPVVIKPADKRFVHTGAGARLVVASGWRTAESASRRLIEATGEVIVQEHVAGPDSNIFFCLFYRASGERTVIFTGRKLASSPPGIGSTAFCTHAGDIAQRLQRTTEVLLEQVDYEGFGGIEYKWEPTTGQFVIIEPTVGRTDWQTEIATLAGTNIPLAGYCHECGIPYAASAVDRRIVWQASYTERIKVGVDAIAEDAAVVDGYWRRDDPLPAFVHYPKDVLISAPAMIKGAVDRWAERLSRRFSQLVRSGGTV